MTSEFFERLGILSVGEAIEKFGFPKQRVFLEVVKALNKVVKIGRHVVYWLR